MNIKIVQGDLRQDIHYKFGNVVNGIDKPIEVPEAVDEMESGWYPLHKETLSRRLACNLTQGDELYNFCKIFNHFIDILKFIGFIYKFQKLSNVASLI